MTEDRGADRALPKQADALSAGARAELEALGFSASGRMLEPGARGLVVGDGLVIPKQAISASANATAEIPADAITAGMRASAAVRDRHAAPRKSTARPAERGGNPSENDPSRVAETTCAASITAV